MSEQDPQWEHQKAVVDSSLDQQWLESRQAMHEEMASQPLTWTTDKPTKPGWYWWKKSRQQKDGMGRVYFSNNGKGNLRIALDGKKMRPEINTFSDDETLWYGPLEVPE